MASGSAFAFHDLRSDVRAQIKERGETMKPAKLSQICVVLVVGLMAMGTAALAVDANTVPMGEIRQACDKYLTSCVSPKEIKKMEKKLRDQVETKVADQNLSEDTAMRHIMLDWAAGNAKSLESRNPATVKQACFYFVRFYDNGYQIPGQIRERLTPENARKLIDWLETEAQRNQLLAAK